MDRLEPGKRRRGAGAGQRGHSDGAEPGHPGKPKAHHHLVTERNGAPLAVTQTAANANECTVPVRPVDALMALRHPRGRTGRPRRRLAKLHADTAYASRTNRAALRKRHITPHRPAGDRIE